jgi:hypothetical protein
MLAAGCEDGCLRLYDVTQGGGPEYLRTFDKQEGMGRLTIGDPIKVPILVRLRGTKRKE